MEKRKEQLQEAIFYFKLFNNIKDNSEVELAEREIRSVFGPVERVRNFTDELLFGELSKATELLRATKEGKQENQPRFQDVLTYELPYGKVQGFKGHGAVSILPKVVRRLAYTKEIYVLAVVGSSLSTSSSSTPSSLSVEKSSFRPKLAKDINLFFYRGDGISIIRAVTNQFFLEKSAYISKLSRNVEELEANLNVLLQFPKSEMYRIPATETLAVGRRLQDWFAIREEPSLYLTHYMHPYKGKFHPKMARALINYVCPKEKGLVVDNFSGSGTTLVEAQWLGLDSIGIDINPLSSLMSQVKVQCLALDPSKLKQDIDEFLAELETVRQQQVLQPNGQFTLLSDGGSKKSGLISKLPPSVMQSIPQEQIQTVVLADLVLKSKYGALRGRNPTHEFLLLGLSGAISDIGRRTKSQPLQRALKDRLYNLWRRVYLARKLRSQLGVRLGVGECLVGDTRDMKNLKAISGARRAIEDDSVDCIVDSPPYSTALDYIRNDLPQLSLLELAVDPDGLERNLIGNPNLKFYASDLSKSIVEEASPFSDLPEEGKQTLGRMMASGREREARRVLKFWVDMQLTLKEMDRVLKSNTGRAAIVIGDNNIQLTKGSGKFERIPNVKVIEEMSKQAGFELIETINREIEKSMTGMIRNEAIIILRKRRQR